MKLRRALSGVPGTTKAWQLIVDLVETYAIAAIVPGAGPHGKLTAWKLCGDDFCYLTNTIIGGVVANVEY